MAPKTETHEHKTHDPACEQGIGQKSTSAIKYHQDGLWTMQQEKANQVKHKAIQDVQSKDLLELIHMDMMGPMQIGSIAGKRYVLVLGDDYSLFT